MVPDDTFTSTVQVLEWASRLPSPRKDNDGYFPGVWFRGHPVSSWKLIPGVYRCKFTERAKGFWVDGLSYNKLSANRKSELGGRAERQRLNLERTIVHDFLQVGGHLLEAQNPIEEYFLAQHFGMPTRLLDWSTNVLVALFMAVADDNSEHSKQPGAVIAIDPTAHLPDDRRPFQAIMAPNHPFAKDAIDVVMAWKNEPEYEAHILPVRPNTRLGRIERQASCFTLHSYGSKRKENATLRCCLIDANEKPKIREMLSGLSINQFTVYNTLDHLSREFRRTWGLKSNSK
jgi:hypothetical protein